MPAYNFQLLLKHILNYGVAWAPEQEIVYRDLVRHSYTTIVRTGAPARQRPPVPGSEAGNPGGRH